MAFYTCTMSIPGLTGNEQYTFDTTDELDALMRAKIAQKTASAQALVTSGQTATDKLDGTA